MEVHKQHLTFVKPFGGALHRRAGFAGKIDPSLPTSAGKGQQESLRLLSFMDEMRQHGVELASTMQQPITQDHAYNHQLLCAEEGASK